jgi:alcohol dehydrogenase
VIVDRRLDPSVFATHRFELGETEEAYDVFANEGANHALKVVLSAHPVHLEPGEEKQLITA